jgi:hypothetical protein
MKIENPNRRIAAACSVIILVGIVMIFIPGASGMDGMQGGYALSFFGIFVAIVGLIAVIMFARMAVLQDRVLQPDNILAHWQYSSEEWRQYIEKEHGEDKKDKSNLFYLIAGISVVVGIVMWFIYPDSRLVTFLTILGIIVVIGITAFLSINSVYRWNKKHSGEIYIARDGAYFSGRFHIWKGLGTRLDSIRYEEAANQPRIVVKYSSPNFLTGNSYNVRIPVPPGQTEAVTKIVSQIKTLQRSRL